MVSFASDYTTGAHPEILKRLAETNFESLPGYGTDKYCESAKKKICDCIGMENADVEFLVGGTQTNAVIISTVLKDYEAVISAKSGHINQHESGAVEYTGHKVIEIDQTMGKIDIQALKSYLSAFYSDRNNEHMTFPGMVYISHPTEYGTLYSKSELEQISSVCREYGMTLFLDGARLGYGLMSNSTDVTIKDIAELCDVFYIGGTKVGALCGEAVVFTKNNKPAHFTNLIKKRGALLAKGRLLGIQFDTLFTDDLYFRISRHAIEMAEKLKKIIAGHGIRFFIDSPTNQQFVILDDRTMEKLGDKLIFSFWEKYDSDSTVVRFATSWSTTEEDLAYLEKSLKECL